MNQDVYRPPKPFHLFDGVCDIGLEGAICLNKHQMGRDRLQIDQGLCTHRLIAPQDGHFSPLSEQPLGAGQSDPLGATSHESHLVFDAGQIGHGQVCSIEVHRGVFQKNLGLFIHGVINHLAFIDDGSAATLQIGIENADQLGVMANALGADSAEISPLEGNGG